LTQYKQMKFLFDPVNKTIFGYSPKCGLTHINNLFDFLFDKQPSNHSHNHHMDKIPPDIEEYTMILVVRNPFERIISGFIHRYGRSSCYQNLWNQYLDKPLTFRNFVDELTTQKKNAIMIDWYHFIPQTSEDFHKIMSNINGYASLKIYNGTPEGRLARDSTARTKDVNMYPFDKTPKSILIYEIGKIDYAHLEKIYGKSIPSNIQNFRGGHENRSRESISYPVYDLHINEYLSKRPLTACFFDDDILAKVSAFYEADLKFLRSVGMEIKVPDIANVPPSPTPAPPHHPHP